MESGAEEGWQSGSRRRERRGLLILAALLVAVILSVNSWVAYRAARAVFDRGREVDDTRQNLRALDALFSMVQDAETGQRGYLITGDKAYLAPYLNADVKVRDRLGAVAAKMNSNPKERALVEQLRLHIGRKLQELAQTVAMRAKSGFAATRGEVLTGVGRTEMEAIRRTVAKIVTPEQVRLRVEEQAQQDSARRLSNTFRLSTVLNIALLAICAGLVLRVLGHLGLQEVAAEDSRRRQRELETEIGRRHEAESEVQHLNDELEQRVVTRTAELSAANEELEGFTYSIAHDLRAPLRHIVASSHILRDEAAGALGAEHVAMLRRQEDNANRLGALIDDLLRYSRLAREPVRREHLNLSDLAAEVAQEAGNQPGQALCTFKIAPGMEAYGDRGLVRLVLQNLIGNACKYSPLGGVVEVGQLLDGNQRITYVQDQGIGFESEYAEKIFRPFERLVRLDQFPGTGIGLANVERVVRRHGGRVWAQSSLGNGAKFFFTLGSP